MFWPSARNVSQLRTQHSPEWNAQVIVRQSRIPSAEDLARELYWANYWRKVDGLPPIE